MLMVVSTFAGILMVPMSVAADLATHSTVICTHVPVNSIHCYRCKCSTLHIGSVNQHC